MVWFVGGDPQVGRPWRLVHGSELESIYRTLFVIERNELQLEHIAYCTHGILCFVMP